MVNMGNFSYVNIAFLLSIQVLNLLDALHLSQYKNEFENEAVDGLLFIDLDKNMLEELNVTSKLHQRKIMQVIEGVKSISELMCD